MTERIVFRDFDGKAQGGVLARLRAARPQQHAMAVRVS